MKRITRTTQRYFIHYVLLLALCGTWSSSADAQPLTLLVGGDGSCSFNNVQAAINAAADNPGFDEIHIANNANYLAQALTINNQVLTITGGYSSCASATSTGSSTLSGAGGSHDSVLTIGGGGNDVILNSLSIIRGDEVSDGVGGGIDFRASGTLTLRNTSLSQNYAGYGGGINFSGDGGFAELRLEEGSVILSNTAQYSGGGVRVRGNAEMNMFADNSQIGNNEALGSTPGGQPLYGTGGGIEVIAPAIANISSPGIGIAGAIVNNRASYGGGIAIVGEGGNDDEAIVTLFTSDPARPIRIQGNTASQRGGGIYLKPNAESFPSGISSATLFARNFRIDANAAAQGSALNLDDASATGNSARSSAYLNSSVGTLGVACAAGTPCNTIDGNLAQTINGTATTGAAIQVAERSNILVRTFALRGNRGGFAVRLAGDAGSTNYEGVFSDCLISDNVVSAHLLSAESGADLELDDCTIANNSIGAPRVINASDNLILRRSILDEPGKISATIGGSRTIDNIVTSERISLDGGNSPTVVEADPRFIDPGHGDYHLRSASPAIDFAPAITGDDRDLDGLPRDQDLVLHFNRNGVRDLGAFERQTSLPLVLNADFDSDLVHWPEVSPGYSARDASQSVSGPAGSGSLAVTEPAPSSGAPLRVVVRKQCIHLPTAGTYVLNGYGRATNATTTQADTALLNWEFRSNGGEACDAGVATRSADHILATSGGWSHPINPALILVSESEWTSNSSIAISLVRKHVGPLHTAGTVSTRFDGISLTVNGQSDVLFEDGFE
ncbi:MAG: hypothetical protein ABI411_16310 [Tahibacter sp.]